MAHKWVHLGWSMAAIAAFYTGFQMAGQSAAGGNGSKNPRLGAGPSLPLMPGQRDPRGEPGGGESAIDGPLVTLFGAYNPQRGSLKVLAQQAVTDPSPITRRLAFAHLLERMTADNALEIRDQLVTLKPDEQTWEAFNYAWGALAGREAFDFARQSEEADLGATLMGWAAADPRAALAAMDSLPSELEGQRAQLEQNLVAGIADHDLALATQVALDFSNSTPGQTNRLMRTVANEALRTGGTESASLWVRSLPDGDAKGAAMRRVSETYVREDPAAAAAWAETFADKAYASSAIGEIGEEWAETDAAAAVAWVETLPEGGAQNRGFSEVLGEWEDRDPRAASEYLMAMEPSPQRDAAVAGFASGYAWQDPQAASAWAQDIRDPQIRERALMRVGYAYHRRDPETARVWLQGSGLTPDQQRAAIRGRR